MMNFMGDSVNKLEYYKSNELSAASFEAPANARGSVGAQTSSAVEGKSGKDDVMSPEREEQLELWMENVKAFIRQIDVSSL